MSQHLRGGGSALGGRAADTSERQKIKNFYGLLRSLWAAGSFNMMSQETFDPDKIHFRNMILSDLERVYEMEKSIFPSPWSKESIRYFLEEDRYTEAIVCEIDKKVIGYAFCWIVAVEVHIANIAVDVPYRGKKIGKRLMQYMLRRGKNAGAEYAVLEVRQSNKIAIRMYNTFGFSKTAVRNKYYSDNQEDAVIMKKYFKEPTQWTGLKELKKD